MARESIERALKRWEALELLQESYPTFGEFLYDGMTDLLGFSCSDIQLDIANYVENGNLYRMVMAQRGQAKTTITAFYAVFRLIHDPSTRVLIFSAGGTMASEVSNWIIQIINGWDILSCLRGDGQSGDRSSVEAFDVHHSLKGFEKSPSVACIGITGNMQGKRADLLIADDVESSKNSQTETMREQLLHRCRDFASICSSGDIIYLGTQQSNDSIYNHLPAMGFDIRIWPGRYPTEKEEEHYGNFLAPLIKERIEANPELRTGYGLTGERGAAVDPILVPEEELVKKERYQGKAYFQLQYMLNTSLADEDRYPLKTKNLIVAALNKQEAPTSLKWMPNDGLRILSDRNIARASLYRPFNVSKDMQPYTEKVMYVDPAGGGANGDETAYAVVYMLSGTLFLMGIGSVSGGFEEDTFDKLSKVAYEHQVHKILVESNFANGGFGVVWKPKLDDFYEQMSEGEKRYGPTIEDDRAVAQKELRIIDTLEPIMARHSLVVDEDVIRQDYNACAPQPPEKRKIYSLFFQMQKITRTKGALRHDDRLDALAGACKYFHESLMQNAQRMATKNKEEETEGFFEELRNNGLRRQYGNISPSKGKTSYNKFNRYRGVKFK